MFLTHTHTQNTTTMTTKGNKENFGGDAYVYYTDCRGSFRGISILPNLSNCVY